MSWQRLLGRDVPEKQIEIPEGYTLSVRHDGFCNWDAKLTSGASGRDYSAWACLTRSGAIRSVLKQYRKQYRRDQAGGGGWKEIR